MEETECLYYVVLWLWLWLEEIQEAGIIDENALQTIGGSVWNSGGEAFDLDYGDSGRSSMNVL
jgi:hypothetical protein